MNEREVEPIERVSIELSQRCKKACWFCYSGSHGQGGTELTPDEVLGFVRDLAANGVRAVSFGGGEPLEYDGLFELLRGLRGVLFRSLTSNGLALVHDHVLEALIAAAPDKVHLSIHFPDRKQEVERVTSQVQLLRAHGIPSGVNLLVARSGVAAARWALEQLQQAGVGLDRVVLLPMRGQDTPSARQLSELAGGRPFQSMTCLTACGKSPRFCAVSWDKTVAWCSYTSQRQALPALTYAALIATIRGLGVTFCGGTDDGQLVRLSRGAQHGYDLVRGRR